MRKIVFLSLALFLGLLLNCSKNSTDDNVEEQGQEQPQNVDKTPNLQATGDSANDILSNTNFDKLLIEIAHVEGFRPTQASMDNFMAYLEQHTFKQDIELTFKSLASPNEEALELQEVADLEIDNRTVFNNGTTLAIYIYFADAPSDGDDIDQGLVTLGAVYRNTSMVIYESTVRSLASRSSTISVTDVETATLNHEFGHLFGLVNIGTTPVNDHESQSENEDGMLVGDNHCNVQGCLMRAELQFGSVQNNKAGKTNGLKADCTISGKSMMQLLERQVAKGAMPVPGLDAECILDLQSNGGR